jgi:group I intron endonuclease
MGVIYRIISPSGKAYYGQTTKEVGKRWRKHQLAAEKGEGKKVCHAINRAIRKYGWDNMIKDIVEECDNEKLNEREIYWIADKGSLYPGGYNLTTGGAGCVHIHSQWEREKRSKALRKSELTKDLPMYAKYRKTKYGVGFIYERPGKPAVQFTSPDKTLDENKRLMLEHIAELEKNPDLVIYRKRTHDKGFKPIRYLSYQKRIDGFVVNKPGTSRKTFSDKKMSLEEKYNAAKKHLESLK